MATARTKKATKLYWWQGKPEEIFWCEITDRVNIGDDLLCPQVDESGKPYWSYSLIRLIKPGDIVFHYSTKIKAFVGASVAHGSYVNDSFVWAPHGTVGRSKTEERETRPAWRLPIGDFKAAHKPLFLKALQDDQTWIRDWIAIRNESGPVMSPFQPYPKLLRATQGYLTKMPGDFVARWPELGDVAANLGSPYSTDADSALVHLAEEQAARKSGQGFLVNPTVRRAIEEYAVARAKSHFGKRWKHIEEKGKPYDLLCSNDDKILHVEVKGTTTDGVQVFLTRNEVAHARENKEAMSLFIVRNVKVSGTPEKPIVSEGVQVVFDPWDIDAGELEAMTYSFRLPGAS